MRRRRRNWRSSPRSTGPVCTWRHSWPACRARCCSAPRCRTSVSGACSTWSQSSPRRRTRGRTSRASRARSTRRDRMAFVRVCSGRFERGMVLTHAATGRPFATKYAQSMFGQDRETVEEAFPGDVIGLVNATALRPGDTLYAGEVPVEFPPIPSFAPEHFAVVRGKEAGEQKQFRRGIEQLDTEGVVQVLSSDLRGDQAPVLAAVGPLQYDVVLHRLEHEFGARADLDHLDYTMARRTDADRARALAGPRAGEGLTR